MTVDKISCFELTIIPPIPRSKTFKFPASLTPLRVMFHSAACDDNNGIPAPLWKSPTKAANARMRRMVVFFREDLKQTRRRRSARAVFEVISRCLPVERVVGVIRRFFGKESMSARGCRRRRGRKKSRTGDEDSHAVGGSLESSGSGILDKELDLCE